MTPRTNNVSAHDLRKLERKTQDGKPLTAAERAAVAAVSGHNNRWARNQVQLAAALGVARQTVVTWRKDGAPAPTSDGRYEIAAWREWVKVNSKNERATLRADARKDAAAKAKLKAMARRLQLMNEKLETEIGIMKGDFIPAMDVERDLTLLVVAARRVGESMPASLAPQLAGLDVVGVEKRLRDWWDEFFETLNRGDAEQAAGDDDDEVRE